MGLSLENFFSGYCSLRVVAPSPRHSSGGFRFSFVGGRVRAARRRLLILALRETPRRCIFDLSSHVREFDKTVLECGVEVLDSGFFVSGTWILDCNRQWDSGFVELYSGFQSQGFRIPHAKVSRSPEFGFSYTGRTLSILFLFYFMFLRFILSGHVHQQPIIRTVNWLLLVRDYQFRQFHPPAPNWPGGVCGCNLHLRSRQVLHNPLSKLRTEEIKVIVLRWISAVE